MKIVRYPHKRPLDNCSCVTIGNFDGVHLGHQKLIQKVVNQAQKQNCLSVVVTMHPLPQQFFSDKFAVTILSDFRLKSQLLEQLGVDVMCLLNFNHNLAAMKARDFYHQILRIGLKSKSILVGDDFKFGHNRQGDFQSLKQWGDKDHIHVEQMHSIQFDGLRVSSTAIRELLINDDLVSAKQMLGRDFNLIGQVAHGRKMGRTLGFPTINIELNHGGFPLHGIYATHIIIDGQSYPSVTSVGFNPTVGGNAKRVEVHVFDFNREIYGETVEVLFYKKLRNEVEFGSLTELTDAIAHDVKIGREFFAR
jgi:riboflavin kinase/FMN adenylyltransferase